MKSIDYVKNFYEDRKYLIKKYPNTWGKMQILKIKRVSILDLPSPQLLAAFSSYLKYQHQGKVYCRGERHFYESTIPSLFRDIDDNEIEIRKKAFDGLVTSLPDLFTSKRFKNEDFRPLLQHYGIKTDWLDLVDDIFVALWFSNNGSNETFSYIKFFSDNDLEIRKLRENHSSLSLRPHCQHGLSATKNAQWNRENIDFNDCLIAIVRIPNVPKMHLSGYIFTDEYMFPNEELDNTYKLFKRKIFQENLDRITAKFGSTNNVLGKIR